MMTSAAAKPLTGRRIAVPDKNGDLEARAWKTEDHRCSTVLSPGGRVGRD
jgi:hypothetical protein